MNTEQIDDEPQLSAGEGTIFHAHFGPDDDRTQLDPVEEARKRAQLLQSAEMQGIKPALLPRNDIANGRAA